MRVTPTVVGCCLLAGAWVYCLVLWRALRRARRLRVDTARCCGIACKAPDSGGRLQFGLDLLLVLLPFFLVLAVMTGLGLGGMVLLFVGIPGFLLVDALAWFAADGAAV